MDSQYFKGMNEDEVYTQFAVLTRYVYTTNNKVKTGIFISITSGKLLEFKDTLFSKMTSRDEFPKSLSEIYELYMNDPITDNDRKIFLNRYQLPYQSTGRSIKSLYNNNSLIMKPQLDLHIQNKKIQYILQNLTYICDSIHLKFENLCNISDKLKEDIATLKKKYSTELKNSEEEIAAKWVNIVERKPEFKALESEFNKSKFGKEHQRLYLPNLKGGKYKTHKKSSKRIRKYKGTRHRKNF